MSDRFVAVFEAGTSSARCFVFNSAARIVASRMSAWAYSPDRDRSSLQRQMDPAQVWETFCRLSRAALADAGVSPGQVAAVTATSQRQGLAFLDADGRELYMGPNTDLRAVFQGGVIDEESGRRVYETTGHTPSFLLAPAKLHWFRLQRPDAYDRIATVLTLADWLIYRLSGVVVSEPSLACEVGLLDIRRRRWCSDLLADLDVVSNSHVPLVESGAVAGHVGPAAAEATGLAEETPVVVSGADTQCGLLGMGVVQPGQAGVVAGWSVPLQMVADRPIISPQRRTWSGCHLPALRWTLEGSSGDAGNTYAWLGRTLWNGGHIPYDEMDALAGEVPPGSQEAVALLGPASMDMSSLGFRPGGILFPVPVSANEIGRGHMVRASLEAVAYAVRSNLEQLEALSGGQASFMAVGGGMTQTSTWVRIMADVIGRPIEVAPFHQVSALGAYLCAATALGRFASLEEAAGGARARLVSVEPDPTAASDYQGYYQRWLQLSATLGRLSS